MKQPVERRLAAILAADVAGYSRLMGADEEGTHERLKALRRELLDPKVAEHQRYALMKAKQGFGAASRATPRFGCQPGGLRGNFVAGYLDETDNRTQQPGYPRMSDKECAGEARSAEAAARGAPRTSRRFGCQWIGGEQLSRAGVSISRNITLEAAGIRGMPVYIDRERRRWQNRELRRLVNHFNPGQQP
jgi:class 3 adenylate cyclase